MIISFFDHLQGSLPGYLNDTDKLKLLQDHREDLFFVTSLDLDLVESILLSTYSPNPRRPYRDPKTLLRSLLLMTQRHVASITHWIDQTRKDPLLALLCGFPKDDTPGIGTYYDFIDRLIDGFYQKPCDHFVKKSSLLSKPIRRSLKHEALKKKDLQNPLQPQSETLSNQLLANSHLPRANDSLKILEDLFFQLALILSHQKGFLDTKNLAVSGDGSILPSHASGHPRPICPCRKNKIYRCDCPKPYRSRTAAWCYDHHRDTFIFGDRYYHLVIHQNDYDLPLFTLIPGGNESDFTLSPKAIDRLLKAFREHGLPVNFRYFIADTHHDSYAHYRYLQAQQISPIIPVSANSHNALIQIEGIPTDPLGHPLCPAGAKMRHHQFDSHQLCHIYACPAKYPTRVKGRFTYLFDPKRCPLKQDCLPESSMGPWIRLPVKDNLRLFPPIPRDSNRFKLFYNDRSSTERLNDTVKNDFHLSKASRSAERSQVRLVLANIVIHASLWLRKAKEALGSGQLFQSCLDKLSLRPRELPTISLEKARSSSSPQPNPPGDPSPPAGSGWLPQVLFSSG